MMVWMMTAMSSTQQGEQKMKWREEKRINEKITNNNNNNNIEFEHIFPLELLLSPDTKWNSLEMKSTTMCMWMYIHTSSDNVSKLPLSSPLLFSLPNSLCAFSLSSFGCGVFCRTNGVSLSRTESSENFTECVRDASRSSHPSESESSLSCPSGKFGKLFKFFRKINLIAKLIEINKWNKEKIKINSN